MASSVKLPGKVQKQDFVNNQISPQVEKSRRQRRRVSEAKNKDYTNHTPGGRKLHPPSLKLRWTDGQRFMFLNKKYHIIQAASGACASYRNGVEMLHVVE